MGETIHTDFYWTLPGSKEDKRLSWSFLTQNFPRNPKLLFFIRFEQKFSEKIGF